MPIFFVLFLCLFVEAGDGEKGEEERCMLVGRGLVGSGQRRRVEACCGERDSEAHREESALGGPAGALQCSVERPRALGRLTRTCGSSSCALGSMKSPLCRDTARARSRRRRGVAVACLFIFVEDGVLELPCLFVEECWGVEVVRPDHARVRCQEGGTQR